MSFLQFNTKRTKEAIVKDLLTLKPDAIVTRHFKTFSVINAKVGAETIGVFYNNVILDDYADVVVNLTNDINDWCHVYGDELIYRAS